MCFALLMIVNKVLNLQYTIQRILKSGLKSMYNKNWIYNSLEKKTALMCIILRGKEIGLDSIQNYKILYDCVIVITLNHISSHHFLFIILKNCAGFCIMKNILCKA